MVGEEQVVVGEPEDDPAASERERAVPVPVRIA
jgi:hypothetical protein